MRFKVLPASRQPTKLWFDALSLQPRCRTKRRTPGRLSDGIFAVAMTLLVLDLRVPAATRARLLAGDGPAEIHPAVVRRIVIAQSLYAGGAAPCFLNTYYSIAAIVLVQVNYAIAPRFYWGLFSRKASGD
jgi:hypothetical protein